MPTKITPSHTAPVEDTISNLTDWVEFKALQSDYHAYNLYELASLNEEYEDEENENFAEQDLFNEEIVMRVIDEIAHRAKVLNEAYPFALCHNDKDICLKRNSFNIGQWIYLYCLIISHRTADGVNIDSFDLSNADRDLLQIASVYAAVGHLDDAFSFGFPRPENSGFFDALRDVFAKFGEGTPLTETKLGYSPKVKDGEVDIVAWQVMNDHLPGKKFLLGQVATGANWNQKSIKCAIEYFLDSYFLDSPKSTPIPAMFIPFCIEEQYGGTRHHVMLNLTKQFGIIYYRLRLPYYALMGFNKPNNFHRKNENNKIVDFVKNCLGDQLPDVVFTT